MTTQAISDYLTKQIFIEKNIVTFRSLSRQFSIHVNAAKNELATYHHDAPYQSQTCSATFLISGTSRKRGPSNTQNSNPYALDEDVDMEGTQATDDDEDDESDGEEVQQTKIVLVNEKDLEDANATFDEIRSVHIYSLAPAPLKDAGFICIPTEHVRNTDKSKGPDFSVTVGRTVGKGIKPGKFKKRVPPAASVAGPSKTKGPAAPETKAVDNPETKEKEKVEKPKQTGKLDFFKKVEKSKDAKDAGKAKEIKKEPVADSKKKMFFSNNKPPAKAATKAPSPAPSDSSTKEEKKKETTKEKEKEVPTSVRGVKRKSSISLEEKERQQSPKNPKTSSAKPNVDSSIRVKRKVVLSDDESDSVSAKPVRKAKKNIKVESAENSEAEREAMALMDIDDADVERVSRVPSTAPSTTGEGFEDDIQTAPEDEDVSMTDDTSIKKPKTTATKRKPKAVIPVGQNGLKKRKVTKTRRTIDENGYTRKEDYSDWESVASGEEAEPPAPKTKAKGKTKAVVVKKEDSDEEMPAAPPQKSEKENPEPAVKKAAAKPKPAKLKPTAKEGPKKQAALKNFFGPGKK